MSRGLLLVLVLAAPLLTWRLGRPGFSDTEGMYAEPAREMVATGDWVTPRMNGEPFLTKPPLMYWLPAALFKATGPSEYARIWSVLAALGTLAATGLLGAALFGETAGVFAAAILATSVGFFLEARFLRTDMVLVGAVTLALYCYVRLQRGGSGATAVAFWTVLGLGLLDKGLLAILLPGGVIAGTEILTGELRPRTTGARLRALRAPLGLAVVLAIAVPWHLLAGARNPGFLSDYVVNQHVLFFFDRKLPRDSIPDSLSFFWGVFFARGLPWSLFLPAAVVHAWRARRTEAGPGAGTLLVLVWLALVLGFFSLAASRLEHYALPALPAAALLLGFLLSDARREQLRLPRFALVLPPAAAAALAIGVGVEAPPAWIGSLDPSLAPYGLDTFLRPAAAIAAVGFLTVAVLLATHVERLALGAGVVCAVLLLVCVQLAHERVEPLFSWRPFAAQIEASGLADAPVFFRASDEYQLCGGLDYYIGRPVRLLAPPGWSPPTFLEGHLDRLFTSRAEFERIWLHEAAFLVSDEVETPSDEVALVPGPYARVARAGSRVLLRSNSSPVSGVRP